MTESAFEMRFDPQTIKHLGIRMYSRLAPALAEIISNAYDADAANVTITLTEKNGNPKEIRIEDDGTGISHDEINNKIQGIQQSNLENKMNLCWTGMI